MKQYQAALYIRLSYTDDKSTESDSVQNQRRILTSFVEGQSEIEIVTEKVDDGYSGIIFDRPAFKEMMADIEAGKINCVIVKDLSRLGREYIETGRYLRKIFPSYGVRFIAINDNIDTAQDSGDYLIVSVKSVLNDAYCRDISVKTRTALAVKRERGDYVGAVPIYGYVKDPENRNRLVIDPHPAAIVAEIFAQKLKGMSTQTIASHLNTLGVLSPLSYKKDRGLPTPTGGFGDNPDAKWTASTILRILQDETYTGTLLQGKIGTHNYKVKDRIHRPEAEWLRAEHAHEAVVTQEDFEIVQRLLRTDTRSAPGSDTVPVLSGLLICGCCGATMTRKTNTVKGKQYHYYYCRTTKKNGCTHPVTLKESEIFSYILESIQAQVKHMISVEELLSGSRRQKALAALRQSVDSQLADIEASLIKVRGFKSSLYENLIGGLLDKGDYKVLKANYTTREQELLAAKQTLKEKRSKIDAGLGDREYITAQLHAFEDGTELTRATVVRFIQSIKVLGKKEFQIAYNFQDEYQSILASLKPLLTQEVA